MENENQLQENAQTQEEALNLRHYWHIILERRWLVITAFITVFVLCLVYLFRATPVYQGVATLQIDRDNDNILRVDGMALGNSQDQDYLQTQFRKLRSRPVLQAVATSLRLNQDERYKDAVDIPSELVKDIDISPLRLTRLVEIKAEHTNPKMAKDIATKLAETFVEQNIEQKQNASIDIAKRLEIEAAAQQRKVEAAEKKIQEYAEQHQQVSFEATENIVMQALRDYQAKHVLARSEAEAAERAVAEMDEFLRRGNPVQTLPFIAMNPFIQELTKNMAILNSQFAQIQEQYKEKYPLYMRKVQEIKTLQESLDNAITGLVETRRVEAKFARANEVQMGKLVEQQELERLKLSKLQIDYNLLKRDAQVQTELFNITLAQGKQSELTTRNKINNMHVVEKATDPRNPVKPRWALTIALGILGGIAAGVGLAFFVNYLDDSIKSQDDVETYLKLPFLGYVPNIKTNSVVERDLQAHLHPQSNAAEGFRTIRATISLTHKQHQTKVIAVTSTIPAEGKSLVASNIAIVNAQTGLRTLLVDADLRRPSVHKAFHLHSPVGLASYLTEEGKTLDEITHKSEVPNLDVICCGSVPATPSELIGSKRMGEFIQAIRQKYDRVVMDTPPVSAVSDPLVISAMADGVVFVTKFNRIRREHARKSIQRIQNAGIYILGAVINDIDFEGKDSYYYSYYYYQNRYYASHYNTGGKDRPKGKDLKAKDPVVAGKARNGSNGNGDGGAV